MWGNGASNAIEKALDDVWNVFLQDDSFDEDTIARQEDGSSFDNKNNDGDDGIDALRSTVSESVIHSRVDDDSLKSEPKPTNEVAKSVEKVSFWPKAFGVSDQTDDDPDGSKVDIPDSILIVSQKPSAVATRNRFVEDDMHMIQKGMTHLLTKEDGGTTDLEPKRGKAGWNRRNNARPWHRNEKSRPGQSRKQDKWRRSSKARKNDQSLSRHQLSPPYSKTPSVPKDGHRMKRNTRRSNDSYEHMYNHSFESRDPKNSSFRGNYDDSVRDSSLRKTRKRGYSARGGTVDSRSESRRSVSTKSFLGLRR